MMHRRIARFLPCIILIQAFLACSVAFTQDTDYTVKVNKYIEQYKDIAIQEMKDYGIPASVTLAQGILESNAGQSDLALKANNHFGIKCHKEWTGRRFYKDDDRPDECFRVYDNPFDSYRDHSLFLRSRDRYQSLFTLDVKDYKGWATGLKAAGYATNPKYADLLVGMIERFSLQRFDDPGYQPVIAVKPTDNIVPVTDNIRFTYFAPGPSGRKVYINNHVQLVIASEGDQLRSIASEFGIPAAKLARYNELSPDANLESGQVIYLGKKRSAAEVRLHTAEKGQSMWDISQMYGIRLKKLYQRNNMAPGMEPPVGKVLKLR